MTKTNIIALFVTCVHTHYSVSFTSSREKAGFAALPALCREQIIGATPIHGTNK